MADEPIRIEDRDGVFRIIGAAPLIAVALLRDAINDIADELENVAKALAPEGTEDSGTYPGKTPLKEHPVDRTDTIAGRVEGSSPLFGGGFAVRGAGGRFVKSSGDASSIGRTVAHTEVSVATKPRHAIWVHEGTAGRGEGRIFAKNPSGFFKFRYHGKNYRVRSVRGQKPQPYLTNAYTSVNATYVPVRVDELRAQLRTAI